MTDFDLSPIEVEAVNIVFIKAWIDWPDDWSDGSKDTMHS